MRRLQPGILSHRDVAILRDLARVRLLTGRQIERLHFTGLASANARGSARRRTLGRLADLGLVSTIPRRVGGERAGSAGLVYSLDSRGHRERLLWADDAAPPDAAPPVRRPWAIGWMFVSHSLDVSELYVQLREAEAAAELVLLTFDAEPTAWYQPPSGGRLKPDAHLVIESGGWERHWWIEVDRATESLPTLRRKLGRYLELLAAHDAGPDGVLPRVLVTVPDERRARSLRALVEGVRGGPGFMYVTRHELALQLLPGESARPPPN